MGRFRLSELAKTCLPPDGILPAGRNPTRKPYDLIEVQCPRCKAVLEAPDAAAGHVVACPNCDADLKVPVPAEAQVIDVHAEPLDDSGPEAEPEPDYEDDPFFNPAHQPPPGGQMWGRTIRVGRTGDGSGCCLVGCLLMFLFLFLAVRGFFSLFD